MIRQSAPSMAFAVAVLLAGSWPSGLLAEAVILEPGWMAGQVDLATDGYKVQSLSVNAYGGGYQSQKSVSQSYTGEPAPLDYSMTVQGGDWDYTVNATATARPSPDYCPAGAPYCYQAYTNIYFSPRYFPVGVGETVANDYMATGTVQFQLTVTDASDLARGNSITSWYAQGYAVKSLPAGEEGTNSRSYTHSSYTPCGIWDMPAVGNAAVRVYAYVTVYGTALRDDLTPYSYSQSYSLYTSSSDLLEVDVGTDETNQVVVIPLEIEHVAPPPPDDPQAYDLGAVRGKVDLGLVVDGVDYSDQLGFGNYPTWPYAYHYVYGGGGAYIYANPGDYLMNSVREGPYTFSARSYLWDDDRSLYLYWPYTGGDWLNDQVTVAKDQVSEKNFTNVTGILTGNVQFTGALKKSDSLEYYTLYTYGACDYYVGGTREKQPTCNGYSYDTVYATDADKSYRLFLTPGPWHPYYLRVRANNAGVLGYSGWSDMTLYDYNHYFNGDDGYYNFGRPTEVEAGVSTHENRNYKTGGVSMCFQTAGAGSLRSPSVYGYAYQYNQEGRQEMYVYVSGGSSPDPNTVPKPEVMVYGPEGDYSLTPRAYTEDNTYITFPARQVTLTEKVSKRRCLTSPDLTIQDYVFEASTTAETGTATVTISGTATDEDGIWRIAFFLDDILVHLIDNSATAQAFLLAQTDVTSGLLPTSMDFSYDLEVPAGTHTIGVVVTDGAGEESSDEWEIVVNTAPTANADGYTTNEDVALVRSAPGLLANDTDADGELLSVAGATQPGHGTLTWSADGAFAYAPDPNFNGSDSFTYSITDGKGGADSATVAINVLPVNDPPAASGEDYSTPEDTALVVAAPGLLANDEDIDGDALTASLASAPAHGMVTVSADGSFTYTPNADFFGADSFTYAASDGNGGSDSATVSITVTPINDSPVLSVEIASQPVQYSDGIAPVTISALDIDSAPAALTATWTEPPAGLTLAGGCSPSALGSSCTWTLEGRALVGAGTYAVALTLSDGEFAPGVGTEVIVTQEDASARLDDANPVSVRVSSDGGNSGPFAVVAHVTEAAPDLPADRAAPGDITLAGVGISLVPVGPGGSVSATSCTANDSVEGVRSVTCGFDNVPVETYTVAVTIGGDYYAGSAEDVLTVYDPSLGFTTGGGWFYWPGTSDKTNFGYTMKYGKNGNNVKGSLLLIRHLADGEKYRIKSNALDALAIGQDSSVPFGWASFSGKSSYLEPGMPDAEGNHAFTAYVEDRNEPGSGKDRFWITVRGKDGSLIPAMSLAEPASGNAVGIQGGNIVAPH